MQRRVALLLLAGLVSGLLTACSEAPGARLDIAFIAQDEEGLVLEEGVRLSEAGQRVRAAMSEGLVRFDVGGNVVPGLAERWIITDDGLSYIFRLRDANWPDGEPVTARDVRRSLRDSIAALEGTALGYDLDAIEDIRAMTGRVVEIELRTEIPQFLQLLAQAELGILPPGSDLQGLGPMTLAARQAENDGGGEKQPSGAWNGLTLAPLPPESRGLPSDPDWFARPVGAYRMGAQRATELFSRGELDLVTGGRLVDLPYADTGPLARGNLRLDPAMGLFGLDVRAGDGFLAEPANREAIAAAIDRETLLEPFGIGGWTPTTRIVPANLAGFGTAGSERWEGVPLDTRRAAARSVVARWEADNGEPVELAIALPDGPGSDLLFRKLAQDLAAVGIAATRAQDEGEADLVLRDRVARYLQPRWFLNQFRCSVARRQCEEEADALLEQALDMRDATSRAALLAAAEETLLAANRFIPLGAPVRWSLARSDLGGFIENSLSVHPLFALSTAPI